ncbi:MAG: FecR family protein [Capsulimonadales bacterium]|nr:FecR family protein [Capsulimonadales bacterium]
MKSSPATCRCERGSGILRALGFGSIPLLVAVLVPSALFAQSPVIGRLNTVRQVLLTRQPVAGGNTRFVPAGRNEGVFVGQGIRTLRRSQAEITFTDRSVLRINERTDLVVADTASLRRIQLNTGLVWMRVAKGTATQIETPSATAVARGTEFAVSTLGDGSMLLQVFEGEVAATMDGKETIVGPGQQILVPKGGEVPSAASSIPTHLLPEENGGSYSPWWNEVEDDLGLLVINGTRYGRTLRTTIAGEALQQLAAADLAGNRRSVTPGFFIPDSLDRNRFLQIAQNQLVPDFRSSGLSLDAYRRQFGQQTLAGRYPNLSQGDAAFLNSVRVNDVDSFIRAAVENGAQVNVPIGTRAQYQSGSLRGTPNFDINLLDRTQTNDSLLGIGAAAALLANVAAGNKWNVSVPRIELSGFGLGADPTSLLAGRANVSGLIGKTRYEFESNVMSLIDADIDDKRFSRLASVASVEQNIAPGIQVFAGRRRFYHGPVFQNLNLTQLIADRYSGAGVHVRQGAVRFEGAYVHDTNPAVQGAQNGGLGSLSLRYGGGEFGLHYLHVPELSGKDGFTGSVAYPVVAHRLDLYAEAGRGPDKATLQTYGVYLPALFQLTETDVFLEYGSHTGIGRSFSVVASRDVGPYANFRAFANFNQFEGGGNDTTFGLATLIRFGN